MTTPDGYTQMGRLAMRVEGEWWNAYYAPNDTMEGALLLGSIRFSGVADGSGRRERFIALMRDLVADRIEAETGIRPRWGSEETAPEHERTGRA